MLEKQVENKLKREVEKIGGLYFKFISSGNNGVPDRICIFPSGRLIFVELKKPKGGVVSALQEYQSNRLTKYKQEVIRIYNYDDINRFLESVKYDI